MALGRNDLALVLGIAGFLLGGTAFYFGFRQQQDVRDAKAALDMDGETISQLVDDSTAAKQSMQDTLRRLSAVVQQQRDSADAIEALRKRLDALDGGK